MKSTANHISQANSGSKPGHRSFDRVGLFLSILCGVHCLLTPFILVSAPWFSDIIVNESFHLAMLSFVIPVALLSIIQNSGVKVETLKVMFFGIFLLLLGAVVHYFHDKHGGNHHLKGFILENLLTMAGGALLFFAHLKKLKNCRCSRSHQSNLISEENALH